MECPRCGSVNLVKWGKHKWGQRYKCKDCKKYQTFQGSDLELLEENVKLAKAKQRYQDTNRIERKSFREYARIENAITEYDKEIITLLKEKDFSKEVLSHNVDSKAAAVFHSSDLHLNELVEMAINTFDFEVASKRLQMDVDISRKIYKAFNVSNVLVALTGDILNSDRRLDELLNQATNRAKASILAVDLIKSVILDLSKDFNVSVACVTGNESRMKDEIGWSNISLTDNYDFNIFAMLKYLFSGSDVIFSESGDFGEQIVNVGGKNFLLLHGNENALQSNVEKGIIQICGKISAKRGIQIHYVIFGHLHYARVGDHFARGSSLVGANAYSDGALELISRASQNSYIVTETGQIHSIVVDLQDASKYPGYPFDKSLEAYNPKSASKNKERKVIFEVVI
jgi:predicted phosphodiesterase